MTGSCAVWSMIFPVMLPDLGVAAETGSGRNGSANSNKSSSVVYFIVRVISGCKEKRFTIENMLLSGKTENIEGETPASHPNRKAGSDLLSAFTNRDVSCVFRYSNTDMTGRPIHTCGWSIEKIWPIVGAQSNTMTLSGISCP